MKSLISAFALAAVMGIAAAATPASAADLSAEVVTTTVATGANNCVVVNDGYHDFGEQVCTRKYPWWYTPVRYKNNGGGNFQYSNTPDPKHDCEPYKPHKPHKPYGGYDKPRGKPTYGGKPNYGGGYGGGFGGGFGGFGG